MMHAGEAAHDLYFRDDQRRAIIQNDFIAGFNGERRRAGRHKDARIGAAFDAFASGCVPRFGLGSAGKGAVCIGIGGLSGMLSCALVELCAFVECKLGYNLLAVGRSWQISPALNKNA